MRWLRYALAALVLLMAGKASATPTIRASTSNIAGAGTITVPTNVNGDLLVWFIGGGGMPPTTPSGWTAPAGNSVTGSPGGVVLFRIASSEPASYTVPPNTNTSVMYAIAGAPASTTPDAILWNGTTGTTGTTLNVPVVSGLSTSADLLLGAYVYGWSSGSGITFTENGSLSQDRNPPFATGVNAGLWAGHMTVSGTSSSTQQGTISVSDHIMAVAVALADGPTPTPTFTSAATSTPTFTPAPTQTSTPGPTSTPTFTPAPTATFTPAPTSTPGAGSPNYGLGWW